MTTSTEDELAAESDESTSTPITPEKPSTRRKLAYRRASMRLMLRGVHPEPPRLCEVELPPLNDYDLEKAVVCSICMGPTTEAQILPVKTCFHRFCRRCISRWLTADVAEEEFSLVKKKNCPLCNTNASKRTLVPDREYDRVLALLTAVSFKVWSLLFL